MRAIVVDGEGRILRTVTCDPDIMHLQARPGETLFALTEGDDGQVIDDGAVRVSEDGALTASPNADPPPEIELQLIPS